MNPHPAIRFLIGGNGDKPNDRALSPRTAPASRRCAVCYDASAAGVEGPDGPAIGVGHHAAISHRLSQQGIVAIENYYAAMRADVRSASK
jgi:hypothetical protein